MEMKSNNMEDSAMRRIARFMGMAMSVIIMNAVSVSAVTDTLWIAEDLSGGDTPLWHRITEHEMPNPSFHSGSMSFWCGIDGNLVYENSINQTLLLNYKFDLTGYAHPRLKFWHYLDISPTDQDYACVDISTDNGETWDLDFGKYISTDKWIKIELNLTQYLDETIMIRFRFTTDKYHRTIKHGWFIDDISLVNIAGQKVVYENNFDTESYTDFTHYGVVGEDLWEHTDERSYSGEYSFHAQTGKSNWSALQTPVFDFSNLTSPQLIFYHWYHLPFGTLEQDWSNGAMVEITTDINVTHAEWKKIYPTEGYPGFNNHRDFENPIADTTLTGDSDVEGYYGIQRFWKEAQFDLTEFAGEEQVWIRFSSGTDMWDIWNEKQWYVDEMSITDFVGEDVFYTCDMEFIDKTPEELFADFVLSIDALPAGAFKEHTSMKRAVKRLEKLFAKHPEKREGRLLEIYTWMIRPVHQRVLLKRLAKIENKYIAQGEFEKAARKIEKRVLKYMDGERRDWVINGYESAVHEQGMQLVAFLRETVARASDLEPLGKTVVAPEENVLSVMDAKQSVRIAPNPISAQTSITYRLDAPVSVKLDIYDISGRHIISLAHGAEPAGMRTISWDARDASGNRVSPGTYLLVLGENETHTVHMLHVIR